MGCCKDCKWWPKQYLYDTVKLSVSDGCFACTLPYPDPRREEQLKCPHCETGPDFGCVNFEVKESN